MKLLKGVLRPKTVLELLGLCLVAFSGLRAQSVWIVDRSMGAGAHFADLPAAVAKAKAGDVIRMRPGTYNPAVISKGIAILGDPGSTIMSPTPAGSLSVKGLPASQTAKFSGFKIRGWLTSRFTITGCQGIVALDGIAIGTNPKSQSSTNIYGLTIENSKQVFLRNCNVFRGARIASSHVCAESIQLTGANAYAPFSQPYPSGPGLDVFLSVVIVSGFTIKGGNSVYVGPGRSAPGSSGIQTGVSDLVLAGTAASSVMAGAGSKTPAIYASGGKLLYDSRLSLSSLSGFSLVYARRLPTLHVNRPTSRQLTLQLDSRPRVFTALLVASPGQPLGVGTWGELELQPQTLFVLGTGQASTSGGLAWFISIPGSIASYGLNLAFQAITWDKQGVDLSTPSVFVYH